MRSLLYPFIIWLGALQLRFVALPDSFHGAAAVLSGAAALATVTVMVYRLGVWRQQMDYTRLNVGEAIAQQRQEMNRSFVLLDTRWAGIERSIRTIQRSLAHLDANVTGVAARVQRLEQVQREEAA